MQSDALVGRAVVSAAQDAPEVAHLDPDCRDYPGEVRPATDADRRRGLRLCRRCRWESDRDCHPNLEEIGA